LGIIELDDRSRDRVSSRGDCGERVNISNRVLDKGKEGK
jgi:hypothetical protein